MKNILFLIIVTACATTAIKEAKRAQTPPPTIPPLKSSPSTTKVPRYAVPGKAPQEYREAVKLIEQWGNSNEFFTYMKGKRTYFAHYKGTVEAAIRSFRECLSRGERIGFEFFWPPYPSRVIGSWTGYHMRQNEKIKLGIIARAGHLYHETSHMCGFRHQGNYPGRYDNRNSFPYAVGYDLEDFLTTKAAPTVAGE